MIRRHGRHLGDLAAALVDGELDHDARDRALVHLTHCSACRSEVAQQRQLKARLRGMGDPVVDPGLYAVLGAVGGQPRVLPRRRLLPQHPLRFAAAGTGALVTATFATALVAGGGADHPGQRVTPPVEQFVVEHVATSDQLPLTDPGVGAAAAVAGGGAP